MVSQREEDLTDMRRRLRAAMDDVDGKDLPRVTSELRRVNAELATLAPADDEDELDRMRARHAARRAAS